MSVAFGVSGMALLGIMHPPASGLAFSFASNSSELLLLDELHLHQYPLISSCSCTFLIITDLSINDILIILLGGETKTCTNLLFSLIQQENVVTYIHTLSSSTRCHNDRDGCDHTQLESLQTVSSEFISTIKQYKRKLPITLQPNVLILSRPRHFGSVSVAENSERSLRGRRRKKSWFSNRYE